MLDLKVFKVFKEFREFKAPQERKGHRVQLGKDLTSVARGQVDRIMPPMMW
jgi:hypothetical protein